MSLYPSLKGRRQGDYVVSFYVLGKEKLNDLHGFYSVVGIYDTEEEASKEAKRIKMMLIDKNLPGRVVVHLTGKIEGLLGDDSTYHRNKVLIREDEDAITRDRKEEEALKEKKRKEELLEKQKQVIEEKDEQVDPNSLNHYTKLRVQVHIINKFLESQTKTLDSNKEALAKLQSEIDAKNKEFPEYKEQWFDNFKKNSGMSELP